MNNFTFSQFARRAYLYSSLISYVTGIISSAVLEKRLEFLCEGTSDKFWKNHISSVLKKLFCHRELSDDIPQDISRDESNTVNTTVNSTTGETKHNIPDVDNDKNSSEFKTRQNGSLGCQWEFTKGDPDTFPSVPHGHGKGKKYKLDAYLGFMYEKIDGTTTYKELSTRENREYIIKLWNCDKFRRFAQEALAHFMKQNPNYHWRVANPRKLPEKQRR